MTFRGRLFLGFGVVTLLPLALVSLAVRRQVAGRLTADYQGRVQSLVRVIAADLSQQAVGLADRLAALGRAMADDNRFRLAAVQESPAERPYLLDYAGDVMRLGGLSLLQIQDGDGRILSSGHFRNEYDRVDPELPRFLAGARDGVALVRVRTADQPFLALARLDSVRLGGRWFFLTAGVAVDEAFLGRLTPDSTLRVTLREPGAEAQEPTDEVVSQLAVRFLDATAEPAVVDSAAFVVAQSLEPVRAIRRSVDLLFLAALLASAAAAVLLAGLLSARLSRPLSDLARQTAAIDLERLDVSFQSDRDDEIGALARLLGAMTTRLRTGAARLREAERRLAIGDLARQVNHDIKNGLIPIRNVFRHLAQVARDRPRDLPQVFTERQATVDSSVTYLENLAGNYARLSPRPEAEACDANEAVRQTIARLGETGTTRLESALAEGLPPVKADPLVVRRILENLVGNALDALDGQPGGGGGTVRISTEREPNGVRLTVADTGKGMTKTELERAFDDFFTTKPGGTGLGLSVVRRLVLDAGGSVRVETEPGKGSRFIIELPAA